MAVDNKGGSDLDVFEGLGKKAPRNSQSPSAPPRSVGNGPPPPPPSLRGGDNGAKATMMGVNPPPPPPNAPHSQRSAPPPPPGRSALPAVVAPPPKSGGMPAASPMFPPGNKSKPPPAAATSPTAGGKLDMDWDDEEEATHVFDKERDGSQADAAPAAAPTTREALPEPRPPQSRTFPPVSKPLPAPVKQTLLGVVGPPPPPPSMSSPPMALPPPPQTLRPGGVPPPPSSVGSSFARASSINASSPGPMSSPYPPPPADRPPPPSLPPQQVTAPMAMPPPRSVPPAAVPPPSTNRPHADVHLPLPMPLPNRMEATALVRPPEPNRGALFGGIAAGAVMVLAVIFYLWPKTGQIAVNVSDAKGAAIPHLSILIDGKKQCDSAPCIVSDVPAGPHTIKVEAAGFEQTVDKAVGVESKKDVTVDFTLSPTASAATGIKVTGTQPGAKLFIDDKEIGPLPQELKDLAPGSHKVKVAAGDRFTALEKTVTLGASEMEDLGSVTLKVVKGKATISLGTPGAKVFIVSGSDRRELPTLPISVDIDTTKQWALVASKTGFNDYNQAISFEDGQAEKAFMVLLEPKGAPTTAAPTWTPPAPAWHPPPPAPAPAPSPPPASHESHESHESADTSGGGGGGQAFLNINSIPASSIILDGKPIGQTPKLRYPVSAGSHSVLFVNADQGFKKQISVNVGAGETKAAIGRN